MRTALALLAILLLAGCVGRDAATGDVASAALEPGVAVEPDVVVDPPFAEGVVADATSAPAWREGDAWHVTFLGDGQTAVLVVTEATGTTYTLETTSETLAGYDAMFDVSYLGPIRAADLAGAQQGEPVVYYAFPLEDGKSWTTRWDGFDIELRATRTPKGFDIVGTRDGEPFVEYDYAPALKWWSHIEFAEGYGMHVDRASSAWSGALVQATAEVVFESSSAAPLVNPGSGSFVIDEGQSMARVWIHGGGAAWARAFQLIQPDGMPYDDSIDDVEIGDAGSADPATYSYESFFPPTPGEWRIVGPMAHDPAGWGVVRVHQVAIQPREFSSA